MLCFGPDVDGCHSAENACSIPLNVCNHLPRFGAAACEGMFDFLTLCLVCVLACHSHISFCLDSNGCSACIRAPAGWTCLANIPLTQVVACSLHWLLACVSVLLHLISFSLLGRGKPIFASCMVPYALILSLWTSLSYHSPCWLCLRQSIIFDKLIFFLSYRTTGRSVREMWPRFLRANGGRCCRASVNTNQL